MILSIMGMYDFDKTIFDGFTVPGDLKNDCVSNILMECAELEILYPELDTLKRAITIWSNSNQIAWQKIYHTMTVEYNPIWNVDATIVEDQDSTGNSTTTLSHNDTETIDITDTESVKGFNSNTWSEARKNEKDGTDKHVLTANDNKTDRLDSTINTRRTGNIGVTSTQSLIKEEREVADFNFINYITDSFKYRFCVMVY